MVKFISSSLSPSRSVWGRPRGIHRGLFHQPEGGNHLHSFLSFPAVERARPTKKMQGVKAGGWRAVGVSGEGEAAALGCEAGEGFPHSWALGSGRRDPARTGSLREENGTRQPRSLSS